jgi:hypothetical protein
MGRLLLYYRRLAMSRYLVRMSAVLLLLVLALALHNGAPLVAAQETASISGRVINDLNGDGIEQPGEHGAEGWLVELTWTDPLTPGSAAVSTETRSSDDGYYRFSDLGPGKYFVRLPCAGQPPAQWAGTFPDIRPEHTVGIGYSPGGERSGMDFLVRVVAEPVETDGEITGRLVNDLDRDGNADGDEPGLAGWRVLIRRVDPFPICTEEQSFRYATSGPDGAFAAEGLFHGTYSVGGGLGIEGPRDGQGVVEHWAVTSPTRIHRERGTGDIPFPDATEVLIARGKNSARVDDTCIAVLEGSGSISGFVFRDIDGDEQRNENEPIAQPFFVGLSYVSNVGRLWVNPAIGPWRGDSEGQYRFEGLAAGKYVIGVTVYVGFLNNEYFAFGPFNVGEGETVADLPVPPLPPEPAPTPRPIAGPPVAVHAPITGSDGALPGTRSAIPATVLIITGAIAVGGAAIWLAERAHSASASRRWKG